MVDSTVWFFPTIPVHLTYQFLSEIKTVFLQPLTLWKQEVGKNNQETLNEYMRPDLAYIQGDFTRTLLCIELYVN